MRSLCFTLSITFLLFLLKEGHGSNSCYGHDQGHPKDCTDLYNTGVTKSGVYYIQPLTYPEPFYVYCDMDTDGGGWTTFQRRFDGSVWFFRGWADYKDGFGNINSEYWLGNEKIFYLTAQGNYELRIDLSDFDGESRYAKYNSFRIGDEGNFYKLFIGTYSGDAGPGLGAHDHPGSSFSTKDADHDTSDNNCASLYKGGWWYSACHGSNLNGLYLGGSHASHADGINWYNWLGFNYSLKTTDMKIRRL